MRNTQSRYILLLILAFSMVLLPQVPVYGESSKDKFNLAASDLPHCTDDSPALTADYKVSSSFKMLEGGGLGLDKSFRWKMIFRIGFPFALFYSDGLMDNNNHRGVSSPVIVPPDSDTDSIPDFVERVYNCLVESNYRYEEYFGIDSKRELGWIPFVYSLSNTGPNITEFFYPVFLEPKKHEANAWTEPWFFRSTINLFNASDTYITIDSSGKNFPREPTSKWIYPYLENTIYHEVFHAYQGIFRNISDVFDYLDFWSYEGTAVYAADQALLPPCQNNAQSVLNPPRIPALSAHPGVAARPRQDTLCREPVSNERLSQNSLGPKDASGNDLVGAFNTPWLGLKTNKSPYDTVFFWYYAQQHLQPEFNTNDVIKSFWQDHHGAEAALDSFAAEHYLGGIAEMYHRYMVAHYLQDVVAPPPSTASFARSAAITTVDEYHNAYYDSWWGSSPLIKDIFGRTEVNIDTKNNYILTRLASPISIHGGGSIPDNDMDYLGTRYYLIEPDPSAPLTSTLELSFRMPPERGGVYTVTYLDVTTALTSTKPLAVHQLIPDAAEHMVQISDFGSRAKAGELERVIAVVSKTSEAKNAEFTLTASLLSTAPGAPTSKPVASPDPFSPNNDGINDTTTISYVLPPPTDPAATGYNVSFYLVTPYQEALALDSIQQGAGSQSWEWIPVFNPLINRGKNTIQIVAEEAVGGTGNGNKHILIAEVGVDYTAPPNVLNLRVVKGAAGSTLTWTSVATDTTSTATYRVYSDTRPISDIAAATEYSTVAAPITSLAIPRTTDDRYYAVLAEDEAGNRSAPELVAVPGQKMDVALIYDDTGSMFDEVDEYHQAIESGRSFIESLVDGDRLTIMQMVHPSTHPNFPSTVIDSTTRSDALSFVDQIVPSGMGGDISYIPSDQVLTQAINQFDPNDDRVDLIVVFTDGYDFYRTNLDEIYAAHPTIFAITTSHENNISMLQSIVDGTNAGGKANSRIFIDAIDEAYQQATLARYPISDIDTETVDPGKTETIHYPIDATMSEAMIRLTWDPSGKTPRITLHSPRGHEITPDNLPSGAFYEEGSGEATYRLELPPLPHGQWNIEVANPGGGTSSRSIAAAQKSQNAAEEPITFTIERAANTNLAVSLGKSDSRTLDLTALQDGTPMSDNTAAWVELQSATGVTSTVLMQASRTPGHYTGDVDPVLGTGLFTATVSLRSYDPQNGYIERTFQRPLQFGTPNMYIPQTQWEDIDQDGLINPGDTINLTTWVKNYGTDVATNITGTLDLEAGYGHIINGTTNYPSINVTQTVTNTKPYLIQIDQGAPNGAKLNFVQRIWWNGTAVLTTPLSLQIGAPEITRRSVRWVDRNHEDGRVDPGDTVDLMVDIANQGDGTATSIRGRLSPLDTATHVLSDTASYSALNPGEQATNHTAYTFTVDPATPPGTILHFQHVISAGRTFTDTFNVPVGISQFGDAQHYTATDMPMEIPDDERNSAESGISVEDDRPVGDVNVTVNLTHPLAEQISLTLVSPQGSHIPLVNQTDAIGANFRDTTFNDQAASALVGAPAPFTGVFRPAAPLAVLNGESVSGDWYLVATDTISGTTGTLDSWSLDMRPIVPVCWPQGNDTCIPTATISPTSTEVIEGLGSTTLVTFTVTLDRPSLLPVRIGYTTVNGTATGTLSPYDYTPTQGTLQFSPGETEKTIKVRVINDTTQEPDETFSLRLQNPVQAVLGAPEATVTILDDDTINRVNFWGSSLPTVQEGNTITASIRLTTPARKPISVSYTTKDGTAKAPGDYTAQSGTVTFAIGQQQQDVSISTIADGQTEPSEDFTLELSNAVNATIGSTPSTMATIDASNCADSFEPDNDIAHAQPITTGQPQQHTFCSRLDVDWSRFEATTGITYWVETQYSNPDGFTTLQLYADDGSTILADSYATGPNGAKQLKWQAPTAGTFYLRTTHSSVTTPTETYVLQILPIDGPTPVSTSEPCVDDYEPNNTWMQAQAIDMTSGYYFQEQAFCIAGDEDWFHIDASAGIPYIFQTTESSAYVDPIIEVYDSNNLLVASNDDTSRFDSEVQFTPEVAGSYFVKIRHANPSWGDPSFTYNIWFTTWW